MSDNILSLDNKIFNSNTNNIIYSYNGILCIPYTIEHTNNNIANYGIIFKYNNNNNTITVITILYNIPFNKYTIKIFNELYNITNESQIISIPINVKVIECNTQNYLIPKTIVQTWETHDINGTPLDKTVQLMKQLNPEYTYILYDSKQRIEFISNNFDKDVLDAYNAIKPGSYKADIWKYCYLYINGGVYLDLKSVILYPIDSIISSQTELLLLRERYNLGLCAGLMGTIPKHPLFKAAIDEVVLRIKNRYYGINSIDITSSTMFGYVYNNVYNTTLKSYDFSNEDNIKVRWLQFSNNSEYNFVDSKDVNFKLCNRYYTSYYAVSYPGIPYFIYWKNRDIYND